MIISQTPTRLSLLGGGTDYPDHYLKNGGQTLSVAMNRYTHVTVKPIERLFEYRIKANYSRVETADHIDDLDHPSVRECLRYAQVTEDIEVSVLSDFPARTGIGSSSSFTVGLLKALNGLSEKETSQKELAESAVHVEHNLIGERVGVQDQYTAAFGGLVHLKISNTGDISVNRLGINQEELDNFSSQILLFYTNMRRTASEVLEEQISKTEAGDLDAHLKKMSDLADQGIKLLVSNDGFHNFGDLLHESWKIKKQLSSRVTTPEINNWYELAMNAGASGGKLMGAGGGGFLMMLVEPGRQADVISALAELSVCRIKFDYEGSKLIFPAST